MTARRPQARPVQAAGNGPKIFSFLKGFVVLFATWKVIENMNGIQAYLDNSPTLARYENAVMAAIVVFVSLTMIRFGYNLHGAALQRPKALARLPYILGTVAGFIVGIGPATFLQGVVDRLSGG
ncbi:hypothetical protein [Aliiroseovarius sp. YM-037]|uniref:hypothetical protein n=1 Tax=Aliiroseovarius sp. YM-037 TaxID=3341728 RepID=UPI003A80A119